MIEIRELVFRYRADAGFGLRVDAFDVPAGATAALVGPSGSGKTTLLALIAGTLRAASGRISINRHEVADLSDGAREDFRLRNVGQVFQTFELLNYLTVIENILLPWLIAGGGNKSDRLARAHELLANVGLADKAAARPDRLSQGEQQRVAVCRALFNQPPLLLADEPTGNLDRANKQTVVDLLCEQARQHNSTLLMVTHDDALLGRFDAVFDLHEVAVTMQSDASR